eukprot:TRINITY_DN1360_c0_g1_i1.p1 TRINITY_DN1360_c0_g1~~TRINITY_DN1360_c0_g1_i1.p1  ORF type:complete len:272 (-),score=65.44 TRINITY_DN1360_c0_g1_i1:82-897(-)
MARDELTLQQLTLISAAVSFTETALLHPIDVAKTRAQTSNSWLVNGYKTPGLLGSVRLAFKEGMAFKGVGAAMAGSAQLVVIRAFKLQSLLFGNSFLSSEDGDVKRFSVLAGMGGAVGAFEGLFLTPFEKLKILRQSGGSLSNFRTQIGFTQTIARQAVYGAVLFPVYDAIARYMLWRQDHLTGFQKVMAGTGAALSAVMVGAPLDFWKTRVQANCPQLQESFKLRDYFRGCYLNSWRVLLGTWTSLILYDSLTLSTEKWLHNHTPNAKRT